MEYATLSPLLHGKPTVSRLLPASLRVRLAKSLTSGHGSTNVTKTCCKASLRIRTLLSHLNLLAPQTAASRASTNGTRKTSDHASLLPGLPNPVPAY